MYGEEAYTAAFHPTSLTWPGMSFRKVPSPCYSNKLHLTSSSTRSMDLRRGDLTTPHRRRPHGRQRHHRYNPRSATQHTLLGTSLPHIHSSPSAKLTHYRDISISSSTPTTTTLTRAKKSGKNTSHMQVGGSPSPLKQ